MKKNLKTLVVALLSIFAHGVHSKAASLELLPTANDTIVFDLNSATFETTSGLTYIDVPVYINSTDNQINAIDFWFQFDLTKLTYVSTTSLYGSLDVFSNFNVNNSYLSNTSSTSFSSVYVPTFSPLMKLRFQLLNPCDEIFDTDFFSINALLNGIVSSAKFDYSNNPASISLDSPQPFCSGNDQLYSFESNYNGSPIVDYFWDFGNGLTGVGQNVTTIYNDPGTFTVTLTVLNASGCESTFNETVIINPSPISSFTSSFDQSSNIVTFTNNSTINGGIIVSSYWEFGDNTTSIETNPQHTFPIPAFYDVTLTSTSDIGCRNTFVLSVSATTNILDIGKKDFIEIYPIPANDIIRVNSIHNYDIEIRNVFGQLVKEQTKIFAGKTSTINITDLANGIYLVICRNNIQNITKEIIVEHQ